MEFEKTCLTCKTQWTAPVLDCPHCGGTSWTGGPDFNTESNLHADTVSERFDAKHESTPPALPDEAGEMVRRLRDKSTHILAVGQEAVDIDTVRLIKEAASLIERLAPRWISVQERLPENGQRILIFVRGRVGLSDCAPWAAHYPVTHWQPLPNPPQKGST